MLGHLGWVALALGLATGGALAQDTYASSQNTSARTARIVQGELINLPRGERVRVELTPSGQLKILSQEHLTGPITQLTNAAPKPGVLADDVLVGNHAQSGVLIISFGDGGDGATVLKIESGVDRHLAYRAMLIVSAPGGFKVIPTTVCSIMRKKVAIETWAQPTVGVVLGKFADENGETPVCR